MLVSRETTTGTGDYAGLPAALHVIYAQVTHTPSGWVVSAMVTPKLNHAAHIAIAGATVIALTHASAWPSAPSTRGLAGSDAAAPHADRQRRRTRWASCKTTCGVLAAPYLLWLLGIPHAPAGPPGRGPPHPRRHRPQHPARSASSSRAGTRGCCPTCPSCPSSGAR